LVFRESGWLRSFWTKAVLNEITDAHHCDVLRLRAAAGLLKRKIAAIGVSATGRQGQAPPTVEDCRPQLHWRSPTARCAGLPRLPSAPAAEPSLTSEFYNTQAT
jgi:hypothetical protein